MMDLIEQFVKRLAEEVKADPFFAESEYAVPPTFDIAKGGRKYIKIVKHSSGQASVWGFIEKATGDIYKAAGWSSPAKHARGNIETAVYGGQYLWTGPVYLR